MNPITIILTVFITLFLTACGGGSPNDTSTTGDGSSATGGTTTGGTTTGGTTTGGSSDIITNIGFGSGIGSAFEPGKLTLSNRYALVGGEVTITVNVVSRAQSNTAVAQPYIFKFSSSCTDDGSSAFSFVEVGSESGSVSSVYKNNGCTVDDLVTVKLFSEDGDTELASASSIVKTSTPELGYGTGPEYIKGLISGDKTLSNASSSTLKANAVDTFNLNNLIANDAYEIQWASSCSESSFSIQTQLLSSGNIETRYDANNCTGIDTVSLTLYSVKDLSAPLDAITAEIEIGGSVDLNVQPALGSGEGNYFDSGHVTLSNNYVLTGGSLSLEVSAVNTNAGNTLLDEEYIYQFSSTCGSNDARFSSSLIASGIGKVSNTYYNLGCANSDTITINLFNVNADIATALPLATATSTIPVSIPQLGFGSKANFVDGLISGDKVLTDISNTRLYANAVDVSDINRRIDSNDYEIRWSSSCANSSFSITSQLLTEGNLETRYDANTCTGSDTVSLSLYSINDLATPIDTISAVIEIGGNVDLNISPLLGRGEGNNFNQGQLELNNSYVLAGGNLTIEVKGVNGNDDNSLLTSDYIYKFESSCAAGTTSFSSDTIRNDNGTVTNTYYNQRCSSPDTITVKLFNPNDDVNSAVPLAAASANINTGFPLIGNQTGSNFVNGDISGNKILIDESSTYLSATVVDPLDVNKRIISSEYRVEWSAACADATFSIASQSLNSEVETRYNANTCTVSDTVTFALFNQFGDNLGSINSTITISDSVAPVIPKFGSGSGAGFTEGLLNIAVKALSASGNTRIVANIVDSTDNSLVVGTDYAIAFSSVCASDTPVLSTFDTTEVFTNDGQAEVFYQAIGCTGSDRISANLYAVKNNVVDKSQILGTASETVTIELPEVNSIEYRDMTSQMIAIKGIGFTALPETTEVNFVVKDEFNKPIKGKAVKFKLSNYSVGATLAGVTNGDGSIDAITNQDGVATAFVNSGSSHGSVTVVATTETNSGSTISTQSFAIAITTGIPDQNSFSLSVNKYNPRSWDFDGEKVALTARLNDHFQNPVPDGTQINFIADSGSIQPACVTLEGRCTVEWESTSPRSGINLSEVHKHNSNLQHPTLAGVLNGVHPSNDVTSNAYSEDSNADEDAAWNGGRSGVTTILAYTEGEAGFADANANGLYDDGEDFNRLDEAYLDANEDGVYSAPNENNPFEQLVEYTSNGVQDLAPAKGAPNDYYQGASCTAAAKAVGHCESLVHIRKRQTLIMASGSRPDVKLTKITGRTDLTSESCINVAREGNVSFKYEVSDYNGNTPPVGTVVGFNAEGFETVGSVPLGIPDSNRAYPVGFEVSIKTDGTFSTGSAVFEVPPLDGDISGKATSPILTDDPLSNLEISSRVLRLSGVAVNFDFTVQDACGEKQDNYYEIEMKLNNGEFADGTTSKDWKATDAGIDANGKFTVSFIADGTPSEMNDGLVVSVYDKFNGRYLKTEYKYTVSD